MASDERAIRLAHARQRQGLLVADQSWNRVRRQQPSALDEQTFGEFLGCIDGRVRDDCHSDGLAPTLVRAGDNHSVAYSGHALDGFLDDARAHLVATGRDDVVDASGDGEGAVEAAEVVGEEVMCAGLVDERDGGALGVAEIAGGEHRAREGDATDTVVVGLDDAYADAVQRGAVVDATAGGLARAVRRDDGEAPLTGPLQQGAGCGRAADEDAAVPPGRGEGARVCFVVTVEQVAQLSGHEARVDRRERGSVSGDEAGRLRKALEAPGVEDGGRRAGDDGADDHLGARDVVRRQRQEPRSGADAVVGGGSTRDEGAACQHRAFGSAGGAARRDDEGEVVRCGGECGGVELGCRGACLVRRERRSRAIEGGGEGLVVAGDVGAVDGERNELGHVLHPSHAGRRARAGYMVTVGVLGDA